MIAFERLFLEEKMFRFISRRHTEIERVAVFTELCSPVLGLVTGSDEMIFRAVCSYVRLQKTFIVAECYL